MHTPVNKLGIPIGKTVFRNERLVTGGKCYGLGNMLKNFDTSLVLIPWGCKKTKRLITLYHLTNQLFLCVVNPPWKLQKWFFFLQSGTYKAKPYKRSWYKDSRRRWQASKTTRNSNKYNRYYRMYPAFVVMSCWFALGYSSSIFIFFFHLSLLHNWYWPFLVK